MWWQGESKAPEVIKKCIESKKRLFSKENYQYNLLTKDNWNDYIDFPEYIMDKVGKEITLTHFSGLVRAELIRKYGGLLIDATVCCAKDTLDININNCFTVKK